MKLGREVGAAESKSMLLTFPKPDPARAAKVVESLIVGTQKLGRVRRPKKIKFLPVQWNPAATLRPIAWGERDAALGATVCAHLRDTMPASGKGFGVPWQWQPRVHVPRWVGYAAVAGIVLATLAGAAR